MGARGRKSQAELSVVRTAPLRDPRHRGDLSPPRDLGPDGKGLWRNITSEFTLENSSEVERFYQACLARDRAAKLRKHIDRDGEMIETKGTRRDNPLLKHELAARAFVTRTLANLFPREEKPPKHRSPYGH
jgi:hypothetical protein